MNSWRDDSVSCCGSLKADPHRTELYERTPYDIEMMKRLGKETYEYHALQDDFKNKPRSKS